MEPGNPSPGFIAGSEEPRQHNGSSSRGLGGASASAAANDPHSSLPPLSATVYIRQRLRKRQVCLRRGGLQERSCAGLAQATSRCGTLRASPRGFRAGVVAKARNRSKFPRSRLTGIMRGGSAGPWQKGSLPEHARKSLALPRCRSALGGSWQIPATDHGPVTHHNQQRPTCAQLVLRNALVEWHLDPERILWWHTCPGMSPAWSIPGETLAAGRERCTFSSSNS